MSHDISAIVPDEDDQRHIAFQLADFLRELHAIPVKLLDLGEGPEGSALKSAVDLYEDIRSNLYAFMSPEARARVSEHFEAFIRRPQLHAYVPVLHHGDFGGSNILLDPAQANISGIIDFGFSGIGDPALDLAAVSTFGEVFFHWICERYPDADAITERARFYRGTFALYEALHGLKTNDADAFAAGMAGYR